MAASTTKPYMDWAKPLYDTWFSMWSQQNQLNSQLNETTNERTNTGTEHANTKTSTPFLYRFGIKQTPPAKQSVFPVTPLTEKNSWKNRLTPFGNKSTSVENSSGCDKSEMDISENGIKLDKSITICNTRLSCN